MNMEELQEMEQEVRDGIGNLVDTGKQNLAGDPDWERLQNAIGGMFLAEQCSDPTERRLGIEAALEEIAACKQIFYDRMTPEEQDAMDKLREKLDPQ